jgi:hypothetical protein
MSLSSSSEDEFVEIKNTDTPSHPRFLTPSQREAMLERHRIVGGVPIFDNGKRETHRERKRARVRRRDSEKGERERKNERR